MLVLEGSVRHLWNRQTTTLGPGDAVFVAETDEHSLAALGTRVRLINLAFPADAPELLAGLGAPTAFASGFSVRLTPAQVERFTEYAQALLPMTGRSVIVEFLLWFSRVASRRSSRTTFGESVEPTVGFVPPWFSELISWAEVPGRTPPSMAEFVARSKRSEEHLCRCFRRFRDTSPGSFLTALKLRRAKDLLAHSNWSLADIGFAAGFESLGRFYAAFADSGAPPPGRYRAGLAKSPYTGRAFTERPSVLSTTRFSSPEETQGHADLAPCPTQQT